MEKEIGAVLLNVRTKTIEDRFHYFVRPTLNPTLSPYCRNLTGITQALVDQQETFPVVFSKWLKWLIELNEKKSLRFTAPRLRESVSDGANATFCSWSDFDLGFYLRIECERNRIDERLLPFFKVWIDASILFEVCYLVKSICVVL